jgi:hypothetical protein
VASPCSKRPPPANTGTATKGQTLSDRQVRSVLDREPA